MTGKIKWWWLFTTECASNDHGKLTSLGTLVKTLLRNYRCLTGKDSSLVSTWWRHITRPQTFIDNFIMKQGDSDVACQLDNEKWCQQEQHSLFLLRKLSSVACRESNSEVTDTMAGYMYKPVSTAEGKFRLLLAFRVDDILKLHLARMPRTSRRRRRTR